MNHSGIKPIHADGDAREPAVRIVAVPTEYEIECVALGFALGVLVTTVVTWRGRTKMSTKKARNVYRSGS